MNSVSWVQNAPKTVQGTEQDMLGANAKGYSPATALTAPASTKVLL